VALHEPFTGGLKGTRVEGFRRVAQNEQGVAVAVDGRKGSGINDRVLLRYGDEVEQPLTLEASGESFTFSDSGYVRVTAGAVVAEGRITAMKVRVSGRPKLVLNGVETPATVTGGLLSQKFLEYKRRSAHVRGVRPAEAPAASA
jgi:hypothetical protein